MDSYRRLEETFAGVFYQGEEETLLLSAASGQWAPSNWEIVELLLDRGANVTSRDAYYTFMFALWQHHIQITDKMLAKGFPINSSEGRFVSAPLTLATRGDLEACRYLLSKGASIDVLHGPSSTLHLDGTTETLEAARFRTPQENEVEIYELLIRHGLPLHIELRDGGPTMLHHAAELENLDFAKLLLEQGFDINFCPRDRWSVLDVAKKKGNPAMIELLQAAAEKSRSTESPTPSTNAP